MIRPKPCPPAHPTAPERPRMSTVLETLGGLYQLLRLGIVTRFRLRGRYWQWRLHTAYGRGYPETKLELLRDVLEYARWVHRIRRGG